MYTSNCRHHYNITHSFVYTRCIDNGMMAAKTATNRNAIETIVVKWNCDCCYLFLYWLRYNFLYFAFKCARQRFRLCPKSSIFIHLYTSRTVYKSCRTKWTHPFRQFHFYSLQLFAFLISIYFSRISFRSLALLPQTDVKPSNWIF